MRLSIQTKITLTFVGFVACLLVTTLLFARWSFVEGFRDYIDTLEVHRLEGVAERMKEVWLVDSKWPQDIDSLFREAVLSPPPGPPTHPDGTRLRRPVRRFIGPHPTALFDVNSRQIAGASQSATTWYQVKVPVIVDDELVGYIQSEPRVEVSGPLEDAFLSRHFESMVIIGLIAFVVAIFLSYLITLRMLEPVRQLIHVISELSAGKYDITPETSRQDEFGDLMRDSKALAKILLETRHTQRRMFADISHELRTPLTILSAEIEAIKDGIRPLNQEAMISLEQEVVRLRHLIDDLYEMSVSGVGAMTYQFQMHDVQQSVQALVEVLPQEKSSQFDITLELNPVIARVDHRRFEQLVRNLMFNALAYTEPPGEIKVTLSKSQDTFTLTVSDSAPGIPLDAHDKIFEPLYRLDQSRHRAREGAGLGLAICANIVHAHGGSLSSKPSKLGGLHVTVILPIR